MIYVSDYLFIVSREQKTVYKIFVYKNILKLVCMIGEG